MLGFRLLEGVDLAAAQADLEVNAWTPSRLAVEGDRLRVPREARVWMDGLAAELF